MMNPLRRPLVAFQFVSHRVLRWSLTPVAMFLLVPLNIALVALGAGKVYAAVLIAQAVFYLAAFAGYILAKAGKKNKWLYVPYYFLFMNTNVFRGMNYLRSHSSSGTWEKAKRA